MACFSALCKLFSLPLGSNARKMGSQTRFVFLSGSGVKKIRLSDLPSHVHQRYVNFLSSFPGLAREKCDLRPFLSSFPGPALENQSHNPAFSFTQPRPKLIFRHYENLSPRAMHYNVPNEYPCVCAASISSPSNAAFVADSACSR